MLFEAGLYDKKLNEYLPYQLEHDFIYQSPGLQKHIEKRHPECLPYVELLPAIICSPDYIGINPNEKGESFELVKVFSENILIGVKIDTHNNYLYVATLHTITDAKLKHRLKNGRLKEIDKANSIPYNMDTKK